MTYVPKAREKNLPFFTYDRNGQVLFACITSHIKSTEWKSPKGAAKQIDAIFRSSSFAHHSTPVSIHELSEINVTGLQNITQQYQLIACVASTFHLTLL
jgi:hypothetical protein